MEKKTNEGLKTDTLYFQKSEGKLVFDKVIY